MERTLVKLTLVCLATVALFVALFGFGCGGPQGGNSNGGTPPKTPVALTTVKCGTEPDKDVLKAIYAELEKEKLLAMKEWQFNIMVVGQQVKISGWAKEPFKEQILTTIRAVAPPADCQLNDNDFKDAQIPAGYPHHRQAGCSGNYRPCGDICIPPTDPCHVLGEELPYPIVNANATPNSNRSGNTSTNTGGNSKSNSNGT